MEDYKLTMRSIRKYKIKACKMVNCDCRKCESLYEFNNKYWCAFDTVNRFIEYVNEVKL